MVQRGFGVPFLPLPIGILAVLFPWMWYLALPASLVFVIGEPIDMAARVREEGITDLDQPDRERLRSVANRVRDHMQAELDELVQVHGRSPYRVGSLWQKFRDTKASRWKILPIGWPLAFVRHERDARRPPAKNWLHAFVRDLDLIGYYLPLGWLFLSLCRRLRKPPYGYRGMPKAEAAATRGEFIWRLSERPLPRGGV
jgi:hypothetical protein